MGSRRPVHRQAESVLVHLCRIPRLRRLAAVVHRGGPAPRGRLHLRFQPDLLAHLHPQPRGRHTPHSLHLHGSEVRWPELDHRLGPPAPDPHHRAGDLRVESADSVRCHAPHRRPRRLRWRQLRQLDGEHHLLLPGARKGLGAGPERRRRQPRCRRRPACCSHRHHPAGRRNRQPAHGGHHLDTADHHRRLRRVQIHEQPHQRQR
ncbi:hypothetical protein PJL18_03606 [Paenarthrobacter nicotinovorans]|nr:hypothetical protein [Paenarthrobacter nicotinovorans]